MHKKNIICTLSTLHTPRLQGGKRGARLRPNSFNIPLKRADRMSNDDFDIQKFLEDRIPFEDDYLNK